MGNPLVYIVSWLHLLSYIKALFHKATPMRLLVSHHLPLHELKYCSRTGRQGLAGVGIVYYHSEAASQL